MIENFVLKLGRVRSGPPHVHFRSDGSLLICFSGYAMGIGIVKKLTLDTIVIHTNDRLGFPKDVLTAMNCEDVADHGRTSAVPDGAEDRYGCCHCTQLAESPSLSPNLKLNFVSFIN